MKNTVKDTRDYFLKGVRFHELTVALDQGCYRHLILKKPDTVHWSFHVVTYPNYLVISGDLGAFIFSRTEDMFRFFREDTLSLPYIAEKCLAGKIREFSEEVAREHILDRLAECQDKNRHQLTDDEIEEFFDEAMIDFDNGEDCMLESLRSNWSSDYDLRVGAKTYPGFFEDFYPRSQDFTVEFVYCCLAIQHAIKMYDERTT